MTTKQQLTHYRKALERISDWTMTSKGSCDILRGFARKALIEGRCSECDHSSSSPVCEKCTRNPDTPDKQKRFDYFELLKGKL